MALFFNTTDPPREVRTELRGKPLIIAADGSVEIDDKFAYIVEARGLPLSTTPRPKAEGSPAAPVKPEQKPAAPAPAPAKQEAKAPPAGSPPAKAPAAPAKSEPKPPAKPEANKPGAPAPAADTADEDDDET